MRIVMVIYGRLCFGISQPVKPELRSVERESNKQYVDGPEPGSYFIMSVHGDEVTGHSSTQKVPSIHTEPVCQPFVSLYLDKRVLRSQRLTRKNLLVLVLAFGILSYRSMSLPHAVPSSLFTKEEKAGIVAVQVGRTQW